MPNPTRTFAFDDTRLWEADRPFARIMSAMPARDVEQKAAEETEVPAPVEQEPEAKKTEFTSEGDLPAVAQGAATATAATATASELAFGQDKKEEEPQVEKDTSHLDRGIHTPQEYKASCEKAGKPEKWQDYYRAGHTAADGWEQPYENRRIYAWELKKGTSASKAVQDFIKGPTIADYRVAGVAHDLDELRDEFGDHKFDRMFGSANSNEDAKVPLAQRLRISADLYTVPLIDQMKALAREFEAAENKPKEEPKAAPKQEARHEEKAKVKPEQEQEPAVVAEELGLQQADRELV